MVEIAHPSKFFATVSSILKLCKYAILETFLPEILNKKNLEWKFKTKTEPETIKNTYRIEVTMIKRDG